MKKIILMALALSLSFSIPAHADRGRYNHDRRDHSERSYRSHRDNTLPIIIGMGILGTIIANDRYDRDRRYCETYRLVDNYGRIIRDEYGYSILEKRCYRN